MNNELKTAVYPGTFDPITYGHLDIMNRASKMVSRLIIGVAAEYSSNKKTLFNLEERVELCKRVTQNISNIEIVPVEGLMVDFVREIGAKIVVRGLRAVSDFDYEFKMNMVNNRLAPELETIYLMASEKNQFISSSFVREIAAFHGDLSSFIPEVIIEEINKKLKQAI